MESGWPSVVEMGDQIEQNYELQVHNACSNGNDALAFTLLEEGLTQYPDALGLRLLKLRLLSNCGELCQAEGEAVHLLEEALTPEQRRQTILILAELLGKQGEKSRARAVLETWACEHQDGEVLWLLIKTAFVREDYKEVQRLTEALRETEAELSLLLSGAFYHAEAVRHCDGKEAAWEEYQTLAPMLHRWVTEEPENQEVALCLLMTWTVLGQWEEALALAEQLEHNTQTQGLQEWVRSQQAS